MKKLMIIAMVIGIMANSVSAVITSELFDLVDPSGLGARAIFTLDSGSPTELTIKLVNISTGVPAGFDNAGQLLTGVSWDFGQAVEATSGTAVIGPGGYSINFDQISPQLGAGADVTGEWGYGNSGGTGMLTNSVSVMSAQVTAFGGTNLDGPVGLDGPQAGIATDTPLVDLGGLGAVADSVIITLTLDTSLDNLDFLEENGVIAEFGSDAAFVPEPATVALLGFGALLLRRKKK
ncbi:MAG: XDD4 family exosortase-dependent surface protein [Planctomycetota bacterium]